MIELPISIALVSVLIAGAIGYLYGKILFSRGFLLTGSIRIRDCLLIPVCILLFVTTHVLTATVIGNPGIAWSMPIMMEYYLVPAMWVLKVGFAAFAMAAIVAVGWLQGHPIRIPLILICVAVVGGIDTLARRAAQPNLGDITHKEKAGVILQTNPSTCAAASVANIARKLGVDVNEADMAIHLHTTWAGTSPAQIVYGFKDLGMSATKVFDRDCDLRNVQAPAVLLIEYGGEPDAHAVAYMGQVEDQFDVWDPGSGRVKWTDENVRKRWCGRAIEVRIAD